MSPPRKLRIGSLPIPLDHHLATSIQRLRRPACRQASHPCRSSPALLPHNILPSTTQPLPRRAKPLGKSGSSTSGSNTRQGRPPTTRAMARRASTTPPPRTSPAASGPPPAPPPTARRWAAPARRRTTCTPGPAHPRRRRRRWHSIRRTGGTRTRCPDPDSDYRTKTGDALGSFRNAADGSGLRLL
jgi:hypothetical protein